MTSAPGPQRRLLLVHAHPDDETITTGATMARYAGEGVAVTLITCTRGEQGEIIPPSLAHLTPGAGGSLGAHREAELAAAMRVLGVEDHRFLGAALTEPVSFVDSGMALDHEGVVIPAPDPPVGAFVAASGDQERQIEFEAEVLAQTLRAVQPQVVVTYDPGGGYGHPDHVRAHIITMRAVELAALDGARGERGWVVLKLYWIVMPLSVAQAELEQLALLADRPPAYDPAGWLPSMMIPDGQVTTAINATAYRPAKVEALRAHETQIIVSPDDAHFALSNGRYQPILGTEFFRLVRGQSAGPFDQQGRETDLFAGAFAGLA